MWYLISEIVGSLALATLLGVGVGWWLRTGLRRQAKPRDEPGKHEATSAARIGELETRNRHLEEALQALRLETRGSEGEHARSAVADQGVCAADVSRLEQKIAMLRGRAEAAENRLVAFARAEVSDAQSDGAGREADGESTRDAQSRIAELQNELFVHQARLSAMREEMARLRDQALRADADLGGEREAHAQTRESLTALESVHADCDFAFSALRDKILLLRGRVVELEAAASASEGDGDDEEARDPIDEPRLSTGTSGRWAKSSD